jgi:trimeric autotransporter adhesin
MKPIAPVFVVVVASVLGQQADAGEPSTCTPQLDPQFSIPGLDGIVSAAIQHDDGRGVALFVAGDFECAGDTSAKRIARWDGQSWSALGSGLTVPFDSWARALAVFDDGTGPALYVGGTFLNAGGVNVSHIAKWDGQDWSSVGGGIDGTVTCLAVFDEDGAGSNPPRLFAGGQFGSAGGTPASCLARWDGKNWSAVGGSIPNFGGAWVRALHIHDDGGGAALYVGGNFSQAGTTPAERLAKWNGATWSQVGGGVLGDVCAIASIDAEEPTGPALFVGGRLSTAGGLPVSHIARWDGAAWSSMNGGIAGPSNFIYIGALLVAEESPDVHVLYAGGHFEGVGGAPVANLARWNGSTWTSLPSGSTDLVSGDVLALTMLNDGSSGSRSLIAAGTIGSIGGTFVRNIGRLNGQTWERVGDGNGPNGPVGAMEALPAVAGLPPSLYVGGWFSSVGTIGTPLLARWDGDDWHSMQTGAPVLGAQGPPISDVVLFDDGGGEALFVGGSFTSFGGVAARHVAKFDGNTWSVAGSTGGGDGNVRALCVHDDGQGGGSALYAGGTFLGLGTFASPRIARYDGNTWSGVGAGFNNDVWSLVVFDDPAPGGPALFAGGEFNMSGGIPIAGVAKWSGTAWQPVGVGLSQVLSLHVHDAESGPQLYAGRAYFGGPSNNAVVKWDGTSWSPVGSGLVGSVHCLATFDDGTANAPELYAAGDFEINGGPTRGLAKWNGSEWLPVVGGITDLPGPVICRLASTVNPTTGAPELYIGGEFTTLGGTVSAYFARLTCVQAAPCLADITGGGVVNIDDLLAVIAAWGPCPVPPASCMANVAQGGASAGVVDIDDLLAVISAWGPCP